LSSTIGRQDISLCCTVVYWYYLDLGCHGQSEGRRVSRTGRAGAKSLALTLVSGAEVSELRRIKRVLKLRNERKKIEYNHLVRQRRCRENNLPFRTLTAMPGEVFTTDIASVPLA
jgi:hypothetical protein